MADHLGELRNVEEASPRLGWSEMGRIYAEVGVQLCSGKGLFSHGQGRGRSLDNRNEM